MLQNKSDSPKSSNHTFRTLRILNWAGGSKGYWVEDKVRSPRSIEGLSTLSYIGLVNAVLSLAPPRGWLSMLTLISSVNNGSLLSYGRDVSTPDISAYSPISSAFWNKKYNRNYWIIIQKMRYYYTSWKNTTKFINLLKTILLNLQCIGCYLEFIKLMVQDYIWCKHRTLLS